MSYTKPASMVFVLFAMTAILWASESDEPEETAEAQSPEEAAATDDELAAHLTRRFNALLEESERPDRRGHNRHSHRRRQPRATRELEERIDRLENEERELQEGPGNQERLEDVRREIEQLEDRVEAHHALQDRDRQERDGRHEHRDKRAEQRDRPHGDIRRRMEHMEAAIRHLHEAGLPDIAEQVKERVAAARREFRAMHDHDHDEANVRGVLEEVMGRLEELRNEFGQLRGELEALRDDRKRE